MYHHVVLSLSVPLTSPSFTSFFTHCLPALCPLSCFFPSKGLHTSYFTHAPFSFPPCLHGWLLPVILSTLRCPFTEGAPTPLMECHPSPQDTFHASRFYCVITPMTTGVYLIYLVIYLLSRPAHSMYSSITHRLFSCYISMPGTMLAVQ